MAAAAAASVSSAAAPAPPLLVCVPVGVSARLAGLMTAQQQLKERVVQVSLGRRMGVVFSCSCYVAVTFVVS